MDADVDEAAEFRDVCHDARQHHSHLQILHFFHAAVELEGLSLAARVATGLFQFVHDVGKRGHAHLGRHVALQFNLLLFLPVLDEFYDGAAGILRHLFYKGVALRMYSRVVQRVAAVGNAQESRTLLVGRGAQPRHLLQLCARREGTVLSAVVDDVLCQRRPQSAYVCQQVLRCRVQVHAHQVDAAFHGLVKALLQFRLVHVVLILSHADALRVNLHQLGQRVHQAAAYRHGTAHGHVFVRKLLAGNLRSRIDGGTVLAHDVDAGAARLFQDVGCLAAGRSVAHGDGLDAVFLGHVAKLQHGLQARAARREGEDHFVVQ